MTANRAASVRGRLLNVAKATATDFNQVLVRFALERFLYRLGSSAHADPTRIALRGAFLKKSGITPRPLAAVVDALRASLWPAILLAAARRAGIKKSID